MSRGKDKERIFTSTARRIIEAELKDSLSITGPQAAEVARQAVHAICVHFKKQLIYINSDREFDLSARDLDLWNRFNGGNAAEVAAEFNLSIVQVYKIIKMMREQHRRLTEPRLPGFDD